MARPKKPETLAVVSIRLPDRILEQIDQCASKLQDEMPLLQVTRTDAIRYLIQVGLAEFAKKGVRKGRG